MTLFALIITSVKYHLKLLNVKFLLPMISLKSGLEKVLISPWLVTLLPICRVIPTPQSLISLETPRRYHRELCADVSASSADVSASIEWPPRNRRRRCPKRRRFHMERRRLRIECRYRRIEWRAFYDVSQCFKSVSWYFTSGSRCFTMYHNVLHVLYDV